jgi:ADP-ribose pyrophosphatase YjhB (NUDIX family)
VADETEPTSTAGTPAGRSTRSMAAPNREMLKLRLLHLGGLLTQAVTLGVKAVVADADERILLVRHGYVSGWHLPGGGVEPGETCVEALARELAEEAMIAIDGPPLLHGLFLNTQWSRRNHVAVYLIRAFRILGERAPDWEIKEARFFLRSALPEGATAATRARLAEIFDSGPPTDRW